jgi:hypothetical protein
MDGDRGADGKENPRRLSAAPTRVFSPRWLPTDHDYAARPADISVINRRDRCLDRRPCCTPVG